MRDTHATALSTVALLAPLAVFAPAHLSGCTIEPAGDPSLGSVTLPVNVVNGFIVRNGLRFNGLRLNGLRLNGLRLNGVPLDGLRLLDIRRDGLELDAYSLEGLTLGNVVFDTLTVGIMPLLDLPLDGLDLSSIDHQGAPLDAAKAADVETLLAHIAACALPANECMTYDDLSENPVTRCGAEGLDPGWLSTFADPTLTGVMGTCVLTRAQLAFDPVLHTPVLVERAKVLLQYIVSCALGQGDSLTIMDEFDAPLVLHGELGLAPGWKLGALTSAGERRVSACLASRGNAAGKHVLISMLGPDLPSASPLERAVYRYHEGAYWGDVFSDTPAIHTCSVDGAGLSGRLCTAGMCGFIDEGACADVCTQVDATDGWFSHCGTAGADEVINVFLNIPTRVRMPGQGTCIPLGNDTAVCWGHNDSGQIGDGTIIASTLPSAVFTNPRMLVADRQHACMIDPSNMVSCWGNNLRGQVDIGNPATTVLSPQPLAGVDNDTIELALGRDHVCALQTSGQVMCWGMDDYGSIGRGAGYGKTGPTPALLDNVTTLGGARGGYHMCAIRTDGSVWCWGKNDKGQVGDGTNTKRPAPVATPVTNSVQVCGGEEFTCSRAGDGTVSCWGANQRGQLGNGTGSDSSVPVSVSLPRPAVELSCGALHTCAVLDDGSVRCWGANTYGQLGDNTLVDRLAPVQSLRTDAILSTAPLLGVRSLETADAHTCATLENGTMHCYGANDYGQLGNVGAGTRSKVAVPLLHHHCGDLVCNPLMNETALTCDADC